MVFTGMALLGRDITDAAMFVLHVVPVHKCCTPLARNLRALMAMDMSRWVMRRQKYKTASKMSALVLMPKTTLTLKSLSAISFAFSYPSKPARSKTIWNARCTRPLMAQVSKHLTLPAARSSAFKLLMALSIPTKKWLGQMCITSRLKHWSR